MNTSTPHYQPSNPIIYRAYQGFCRFLFRSLTRLHIEGQANFPDSGPLLVVSNHLHILDPPLLFSILPYHAAVLVAAKYKHALRGLVIRPLNPIFVKRGEIDRQALRKSLHVLKQGGVLGMSPEGTRSKTGGLQEGKKGTAYLAYRAKVPILPIGLWGIENTWHQLRRLRRAEVQVKVGKAFRLPAVEGSPRSADLGRATDLIMKKLAALLPTEHQGIYAKPHQD